jgi:hypothetical protein
MRLMDIGNDYKLLITTDMRKDFNPSMLCPKNLMLLLTRLKTYHPYRGECLYVIQKQNSFKKYSLAGDDDQAILWLGWCRYAKDFNLEKS